MALNLTLKLLRVTYNAMNEKRPYLMTTRSAKAEETKARIRQAAARLYQESPIDAFTYDEVARLAGVAVRTVLRAYPSKDELVLAALFEMAPSGMTVRPSPPGDIAAATAVKFDIYETVGDLVMRQLDDERRLPALKPILDEGRDNHQKSVKMMFAPQLGRLRGAARKDLLTMLVVLTDIYVWKLLRRDMGYSRPKAEAIVRQMIAGVIEGGHCDGQHSLAELVGRRKSSP